MSIAPPGGPPQQSQPMSDVQRILSVLKRPGGMQAPQNPMGRSSSPLTSASVAPQTDYGRA